MRSRVALAVGVGLIVGAAARAEPPDAHDAVVHGSVLYQRECAGCHGPAGRGDGPDASIFRTPPRNLRDGVLDRYPVEAVVRSVRDGGPLPLGLDPAKLKARADEVETLVAHLHRLPDIEWRAVERGEEIYVDRCELCHGPTGQPPADLPAGVQRPRDLSAPSFQRSVDDRALLAAVRDGHRGMPAIPALRREDDARALLAYVRLLSPGFRLYDRYCASCHGQDGRADELVDPARGPRVVFDRAYFRAKDPEELRTKVWHMLAAQRPAMPHFRRRLRDADVRAIVMWLRSRAPGE